MRPRWASPTLGVFVAAAALAVVAAISAPITDDARFYVTAAASYAQWLERVLSFDLGAWQQSAIDRAFGVNAEHPPVGKYLMGLGYLLLHRFAGLCDPLLACRVPVALLWAAVCAGCFHWLRPYLSTRAALVGTVVFASFPRVFFHGHIETLDMPVAALVFASAVVFFEYLRASSLRLLLWGTALYGLALGTKLNAPFLLLAMGVFWLVQQPPRWQGTHLRLQPVPWLWLTMLLVSPLATWLLWPYLWHDTAARLAAYAQFHLRHYPIYAYYAGTLYTRELPPASAPWVLLGITTSVPVLASWLLGLSRGARCDGAAPAALARWATLGAVFQIAPLSLPGVPVYGGVKLFLPAFPFLAVLGAVGFRALDERLASLRARWRNLTAALLLLPSVLTVALYWRAPLSAYSELIGGVRGAVRAGFERQYYDLGYLEIPRALTAVLPRGGTVAFVPNPKEYRSHFAHWHRRGVLAPEVVLGEPHTAAVLVLTHERRWAAYPELAMRYRSRPLLYRMNVAGVPLVSMYGREEHEPKER